MSTPTKSAEPASTHRLPALPPDLLTDKQQSLAADMKEGIARSFQGFVNARDDGAQLGPWNPWLHHPKFRAPICDLTKAVTSDPCVPAAIHRNPRYRRAFQGAVRDLRVRS